MIASATRAAVGAWERLDEEQREEAYRRLERARKMMAVIDAEYVHSSERLRKIADNRRGSVIARDHGLSRAEGRRRAVCARRLRDWTDVSGTRNPDYMPEVREKVLAGVIGADAVQKIDKALRSMPASMQKRLTEVADPHIAKLVERVQVDDLNHLPSMLRAMFGMDDPYSDEDRKRLRWVHVGKQGHDGMSRISGQLTPHLAALLKRLAADHARPGGLLPEGEAADDRRATGQRLHDALEAALAAGYGPGDFPAGHGGWGPNAAQGPATGGGPGCGGSGDGGKSADDDGVTGPGVGPVPLIDPDYGAGVDTGHGSRSADGGQVPGNRGRDPSSRDGRSGSRRRRGRLQPARGTTSIVVVATIDQLASMTGTVSTDTNVQMTVADAVEHCDARNVFFQVLDFRGENLYLGRSQRAGSMAQYLALCAQEGMSSAPRSSAPAAWCHMHHVKAWRFGGGTDIDNLTLVDPATHANVDDSRENPGKWWSRMGTGPDEPRVVWIPPESDDPHRTPGENVHPAGYANPGRTIRRRSGG